MKRKEATRPARDGFTWTGARDEHGVPVELSAYDIERMDRPAIDAYQEDRRQKIAAAEQQAFDADDLERYTEAFVSAGGKERDAKAAFEAQKKVEAAQAANQTNAGARQATRTRIRSRL